MAKIYATRSFKITDDLELSLNKKIVSDGYGMRGKSRWICDAIEKFLTFSDTEFVLDCIEYADEYSSNLNRSASFRPTETVDILVSDWVVKARKKMPELEGVRSKIIRAAIMQNILGSVSSLIKMESIIENN